MKIENFHGGLVVWWFGWGGFGIGIYEVFLKLNGRKI